MSENEKLDIDNVKKSVEILSEVIKIAGDNENVRAAGNELGKSVFTITKTINNALLPIAALNYSFEKAKIYFQKKFAKEITEVCKDIPQDCIVEPKPSIAGPTLTAIKLRKEVKNER